MLATRTPLASNSDVGQRKGGHAILATTVHGYVSIEGAMPKTAPLLPTLVFRAVREVAA
jgi:hypothetical protein